MTVRPNRQSRPLLAASACALLAGCASTAHITASQERQIVAPPRGIAIALDHGETLPFGIAPDLVADAAARAGFTLGGDAPRYRLALTAAENVSDAGSYLPVEGAKARPNWIARPDHSWRALFGRGQVLRITAVLIDNENNKEVWRGTGTLRKRDPRGAAPELVRELLAKLPHG